LGKKERQQKKKQKQKEINNKQKIMWRLFCFSFPPNKSFPPELKSFLFSLLQGEEN
jgi:hypothetical protein